MEWKIDDVEEPFEELFERAEREGPQRVEHRGRHFLVIVEQGGKKEENALVRAFLDEPAFKDLDIERVDAQVAEKKGSMPLPETGQEERPRNRVVDLLVNGPDWNEVAIERIPGSIQDVDL